MRTHTFIHLISKFLFPHVSTPVYEVFLCMYRNLTHACALVSLRVSVCVCVCARVYTCVHVNKHVHVHTQTTHTCTHSHTHLPTAHRACNIHVYTRRYTNNSHTSHTHIPTHLPTAKAHDHVVMSVHDILQDMRMSVQDILHHILHHILLSLHHVVTCAVRS